MCVFVVLFYVREGTLMLADPFPGLLGNEAMYDVVCLDITGRWPIPPLLGWLVGHFVYDCGDWRYRLV